MMDDIKPQRSSAADTPDSIEPATENVAVMPQPTSFAPGHIIGVGHDNDQASHGHSPKHSAPPKGKGPKAWLYKLKHLSRKQKIILAAIIATVLLLAGGAVWWFVLRNKPAPPPPAPVAQEEPAPPAPPEPLVSRLTGMPIAAELKDTPTTAVMIENSPDARPQAGLYDAGVVFEAIAEGGITRFLAIFQEARPAYIGPVRSARPYFLDFVVPFDAPLAHAGGSPQALAEIKSQGIKDLDHGANGSAYQRVSNRFAPHNLYTSRDQLFAAQNSRGWNTSTFTGFPRKAEAPSATPNAKSIDFAISGFFYNVHYDYDPATNSYIRYEGGKPHTDERAGKAMNPKVVIAPVMGHHYQGVYSVYGDTGTGKAYIFQDGIVTEGTWDKADRKTQIKFLDSTGAPLPLNPGQTWITLAASPQAVTYKP
jgi:hypothetical protein